MSKRLTSNNCLNNKKIKLAHSKYYLNLLEAEDKIHDAILRNDDVLFYNIVKEYPYIFTINHLSMMVEYDRYDMIRDTIVLTDIKPNNAILSKAIRKNYFIIVKIILDLTNIRPDFNDIKYAFDNNFKETFDIISD